MAIVNQENLLIAEPRESSFRLRPEALGSAAFRQAHRVSYAYVAGAMYRGIASADLVIRLGQANMLAFLGTGGLWLDQIEQDILKIKLRLNRGQPFGMLLSLDS